MKQKNTKTVMLGGIFLTNKKLFDLTDTLAYFDHKPYLKIFDRNEKIVYRISIKFRQDSHLAF